MGALIYYKDKKSFVIYLRTKCINPLNAKLNPICHLLTLLGAHHILHVSRLRVNIRSTRQINIHKGRYVSTTDYLTTIKVSQRQQVSTSQVVIIRPIT